MPGNLRYEQKSHCLSEASLRFLRMLLADFQTLRVTRSRNRIEREIISQADF